MSFGRCLRIYDTDLCFLFYIFYSLLKARVLHIECKNLKQSGFVMNTQILHQFSKGDAKTARLGQFMREAQTRTGRDFGDLDTKGYQKLHEWSVEAPLEFYDAVWDFCGVLGDKNGKALCNPDSILDAKFYPDSRISFAENMLKRVHTHPDDPAIIERVAGREDDRVLNWRDLYDAVSRWEQALEKLGIGEGDHVATYLPHIAEAYILMIAVSQRGAVFSSVGTEMGAQAAAARFEQIQPKILIAVDGYKHMAKIGQHPKVEDRISVIKTLQDKVSSLEHSVVIPNLDAPVDVSALDENTVHGG